MCPLKCAFATPTARARTSEAQSRRASQSTSTSTHNVLTHQVHTSGQSGTRPTLTRSRGSAAIDQHNIDLPLAQLLERYSEPRTVDSVPRRRDCKDEIEAA